MAEKLMTTIFVVTNYFFKPEGLMYISVITNKNAHNCLQLQGSIAAQRRHKQSFGADR